MLLALLSSIGSCPPKMVLISKGRSGSSATLSAIQRLTHSPQSFGGEILGSNGEEMAKVSDPTTITSNRIPHQGMPRKAVDASD